MKLQWERLEQILQAKVRLAEDGLKLLTSEESSCDGSLDAIVRRRECRARRDMALALLNDLREAERLATDPPTPTKPRRSHKREAWALAREGTFHTWAGIVQTYDEEPMNNGIRVVITVEEKE